MCSGYKASSSFLRLVTPAPSCCRSNTHTKSHPRYVQRLRGKQQLPAPCHTCSKLLQEQHTHTHTKATQGMCSGYEASSSFLRLATPAPSCCRSNTHTQKATQGMCSGYEASSSFLRLATPAPSCCRSNTHKKPAKLCAAAARQATASGAYTCPKLLQKQRLSQPYIPLSTLTMHTTVPYA